ncbi:uncharacterized protein LOC133203575 [Saccostrea echinata]|uniref:uncharacterized protein LOC133203575 n=1 Tax=Saccostrea echinata TaxID=191078 RepID=UPI002A821CEB|nr:uncharacterized protein LOC133203575 [Saccostrea echinata]
MSLSDGLVVKICDFCAEPVSLFCTICNEGLCQLCVSGHLETDNKSGHFVCLYRERFSGKCKGFLCRIHTTNTCEWTCTSCSQPVCDVCLKIHSIHNVIRIHTLIRRNIKQLKDELFTLNVHFKPYYEKMKKDIYSCIDGQIGKINTVSQVLAPFSNSQTSQRFAFNFEWKECSRKLLRRADTALKQFSVSLPQDILFLALKIERRTKIIEDYSQEIATNLLDYNFLQKLHVRVNFNPMITKLSAKNCFSEVFKTIETYRPTNSAGKQARKKFQVQCDFNSSPSFLPERPHLYPKPMKMVTTIRKSEKELSIPNVYNDSSHFIVSNLEGPVYLVTVLVFSHDGTSRMHGLSVQNLHGEVVCEKSTEVVTHKSPLHCAMALISNQKYLIAVYDVLMEFDLEETFVKTLRKEQYWRYIDVSCTYTGFLLIVQEKKQRGRHREYRISKCDYCGRVLQVIKFDKSFVHYPFKIQEDIHGDVWLIDKGTGRLLILDPTGKAEGTYQAKDFGKPHLLLCDKFGNTVVYSRGQPAIHFIGENLTEIQPIKLRGTVIRSLCCDNEDRLICLCDSGEEEFEIQIFTYMG